MSLAPISVPDRQPSPRLTVNLGSNNPFRNRAASPSSPSPSTPDFRARPLSTNPFLDDTEALTLPSPTTRSMSPKKPSPTSPPLTGNAAELFANLSLDNKPPEKPDERRPPPSRSENIPPRPPNDGKPSSSSHRRPSKDDPDPRRRSRAPRPPGAGDVFADPSESSRSRRPRPRRNSDSSILERPAKPLDPEEEKRRRERRHREREARHRDGKSRSKRPNRRLDLIDKLDVTGVYGTGLFHHDGPFDACNPHRNRKGLRAAPMQAFPKDSRNMALGGAGPNNTNIDLNQFHGRGEEGYADFSASAKKPETTNFNPSSKLEPVHGAESMGLGTSTFLEGAPASRTAIQRRQSETEGQTMQNGGLQRKKSLAQKIRGINSRGGAATGPRMMSPEPYFEPVTSPIDKRPASSSKQRRNEKNPFLQDYDDAYDKKGAKIQEANVDFDVDTNSAARPRSTSSPKAIPGLERRRTAEASSPLGAGDDGRPSTQSGGGGFMSRVKSLRRPKPEKRTMSSE